MYVKLLSRLWMRLKPEGKLAILKSSGISALTCTDEIVVSYIAVLY